MQQMAYLGYQAPQQTAVPPMLFANSILPMIPGSAYNHWHVTREDFQVIFRDKAVADYIRDFENQTTYIVNKLHHDGRLPLGSLPDPDDLWIVASPRMAEKRTLNAWGHAMYQKCVVIIVRDGWAMSRWVAPLERPADLAITTYYGLFDNKPYIVVDDQDGNYIGYDGEIHNIVKEGHALGWKVRREFLLNTEKIRAAQYNLAGFEPPESMPRWAPLTRKKNGASSVNIRQDEPDSSAPEKQDTSHASSQGGILKDENCETYCHSQDTTKYDVHQDFLMNNGHDVLGNTEDISTNVIDSSKSLESAESLSESPWCPETLVGLAKSRHRPGLFEIKDDDVDQGAAEKLLRECESMGLSPTQAWTTIDQHIMAMMDGPTWWATKRTRKIKRFGLDHVVRHWATVEQDLKRDHWSPLDPVPYIGPSLPTDDDLPAYGAGLQVKVDTPSPLIIESTLEPEPISRIVEEVVEAPEPEDVMLDVVAPEPPPIRPRGMVRGYANRMLANIRDEFPGINAYVDARSACHYAVCVEYAPDCWADILCPSDWKEARRLIDDKEEEGMTEDV